MPKPARFFLKESMFALAIAGVLLLPTSRNSTFNNDNNLADSSGRPFVAGDYLAASFAERHHLFGSAVDYYLAAMEKDKNNLSLQEKAFLMLALEGDFTRASVLAQSYMHSGGKKDTLTYLIASVAPLQKENWKQVASILEQAAYNPAEPESILLPMLKAWCLVAQGKKEQAEALFAGLPAQQDAELQQTQRIMMNIAAGNIKQAQEYANSLDVAGLPHRMVDLLIALYQQEGNVAKAQELANRDGYKVQVHPIMQAAGVEDKVRAGLAELMFEAGTQTFRSEQVDTAAMLVQMAISLQPEFEDAYFLKGHIMEELSMDDRALAAFNHLPLSSRFYSPSQLAVASLLNQQGKSNEAIKVLNELDKTNPETPDALLLMGDIHLSSEEFNKAADTYSTAIERIQQRQQEQDNWQVYYARGISYEQSGQWEKAEPDFLKALQLSPDQPAVLNYLGYSWVVMDKNLDKAEEMLRVAVSRKPTDAHILDSYGWALYKLGMYTEALIFLERATMLMPEDPTTNDHLGDGYWKLGRYKEAKFQWRKALMYDPAPEERVAIEQKLQHGLTDTKPLASAE